MRFAATEDEIMVEDMLDRALREARDGAPRVDGHAPRPDPDALRAQLGSLGLWGAWLPEAAGGSDGGPRLLMTLARGLGRVPTHHGLIGGCVLPGAILSRAGREDTLDLAEQMAGGDQPVAVAAMEPGARWDLSVPTMRAEPDGDGYRLTGVKSHVAEGTTAGMFIVSARDRTGISLFLVPADAAGLTVSSYPVTDGTTWAMVRAEGVTVPASARLVGPDDGLATLDQAFTLAAFAAAAESSAPARRHLHRRWITCARGNNSASRWRPNRRCNSALPTCTRISRCCARRCWARPMNCPRAIPGGHGQMWRQRWPLRCRPATLSDGRRSTCTVRSA